MKNSVKIISFNIFALILIFLFVDWGLLASDKYKNIFQINLGDALEKTERYIQPLAHVDKKPVVVMGCSFAWGNDIPQTDSFAYKLQHYTKRKVYNYAHTAHGVQHVLYKIEHSDVFDEIEPEYVIYVFIEDHIKRMLKTFRLPWDKEKYLKYTYSKKNKDIVLKEPEFELKPFDHIKATRLCRLFENFYIDLLSDDLKFEILKAHILRANAALKKKHKNSTFVVIVYNSDLFTQYEISAKPFHTKRWRELEKEGIRVINLDVQEYSYLSKPEYNIKIPVAGVAPHPSGRAWDKIVPVVADRLGL